MPDYDGQEPELDGLARMVGNGVGSPSFELGLPGFYRYVCH